MKVNTIVIQIKNVNQFQKVIRSMHDGYLVKEGNLHKWFSKSKSKDGKKGWVNVVTGGTCASDKPGEGTPKCVSSAKRASMTKAERLSAQRRKKKQILINNLSLVLLNQPMLELTNQKRK
ncbi:MAG: hypothetical protein CM15mV11_1880 [Caudoviricetes sp.]|nr:MAG: hypothetical protein CM15mV11_1880 [Caudoviricetes sp.]